MRGQVRVIPQLLTESEISQMAAMRRGNGKC
jgi:hypothetical protein